MRGHSDCEPLGDRGVALEAPEPRPVVGGLSLWLRYRCGESPPAISAQNYREWIGRHGQVLSERNPPNDPNHRTVHTPLLG